MALEVWPEPAGKGGGAQVKVVVFDLPPGPAMLNRTEGKLFQGHTWQHVPERPSCQKKPREEAEEKEKEQQGCPG